MNWENAKSYACLKVCCNELHIQREAFTWKTLFLHPLNLCHDVTIELSVLLLTVSKTEIRVGFVQTGSEVETIA